MSTFTIEISLSLFIYSFFYILLLLKSIYNLYALCKKPSFTILKIFMLLMIIYNVLRITFLLMISFIYYSTINSNKNYSKSNGLFAFFLYFPELTFWLIIWVFFWISLTSFYIGHINQSNSLLSDQSKNIPLPLRKKWLIILVLLLLIYIIIESLFFIAYFLDDSLNIKNFIENFIAFNMIFIFLLIIFELMKYKRFSGILYKTPKLEKLIKNSNKKIVFIIVIKLIIGFVNVGFFVNNKEIYLDFGPEPDSFQVMLTVVMLSLNLIFQEIIPIIMILTLNLRRICPIKGCLSPLLGLNPSIANPIKEDNTYNVKNLFKSSKKLDYDSLKLDQQPIHYNNNFGILKIADPFDISNENSSRFLENSRFCCRLIDISKLSSILLEGISFQMELYIKTQLQTNKIVKLNGFSMDKKSKELVLVYEYLSNKSLHSLLYESGKKSVLDFNLKLKIICDLASTLNELHNLNVIHGHLTPNNILFDCDFNLKISDLFFFDIKKYLGYSKGYSNKSVYTAPEHLKDNAFIVLQPQIYSDIYSFGMIAWEILKEEEPFKGAAKIEIIKIVVDEDSRPKIGNNIPIEIAQLIRRCWQTNPLLRPNFQIIREFLMEYSKENWG